MLTAQDVAAHSSRDSCWVIIAGQVYDLTQFLDEHPGGPGIILRYAGADATEVYQPIHPPSALEDNIPSSHRLGPVDPASLKNTVADVTRAAPPAQQETNEIPSLSTIISLTDFEDVAREHLSRKAWAYYSSGATEMASLALNRSSWNSILLIPRVMVDVTFADTTTTLAGQPASLPLVIAPTGMSKLSHPKGELCFAEAAGLEGIPFTVSTNASAGIDQIVSSRGSDDINFLFQLYMNRDRAKSTALLRKIAAYSAEKEVQNKEKARLFKAIIVTVDAPAPGKREPDEKIKAEVDLDLGVAGGKAAAPDSKGGGIGRAMGSYIDTNVTWSDVAWIRDQIAPVLSSSPSSPSSSSSSSKSSSALSRFPIGVKGIQSVSDALLAISSGARIIWLSNHGGRGLDTAPPALYVLLELRRDHVWVFDVPGVEFWIDGGVRRGTDVVKALCLGARGVAMGRMFVYALMYGVEGVRHAVQIIRDEVETTLRLIGVSKIADLGPHLINTKALQPLLNDPVPLPSRELEKLRRQVIRSRPRARL